MLLLLLAAMGTAEDTPLPIGSPAWITAAAMTLLAALAFKALAAAVQTRKEEAWHENVSNREELEDKAWTDIDRNGEYHKARGYTLRLSIFEGASYGLAWLEKPGLLPLFAIVSVFPSQKGHVLRSPIFSYERAGRLIDKKDITRIAGAHFPATPERARLQQEVENVLERIEKQQ